MNPSPATVPKTYRPDALMQRLLVVWLPMLVVAVLIFWLSGGMPPTVLQLLFQIVSHWHALQAVLGGEIALPLAIVLVQCLLLLAAWSILTLLVWREIGVFGKLRTRQRVLQTQAQQASGLQIPSQHTDRQAAQGLQMTPAEVDSMLLEDDEAPPKNTGIRVVATAQDDLFDANAAIFELHSEQEEPEVDATTSGILQNREEEMVFVYGNPFDGELPEVFQYDLDLKREVQDLQLQSDLGQQSQESLRMDEREALDAVASFPSEKQGKSLRMDEREALDAVASFPSEKQGQEQERERQHIGPTTED